MKTQKSPLKSQIFFNKKIMKIIIATQSPPKVQAIQEAIAKCPYLQNENIEIVSMKAKSGVSDMPTSMEENMLGAKNRAFDAQNQVSDADFYIGMEGGTSFILDKTYLFGAVYILAKNGE